jgi:hypothetical protein
MKAKKSAVGLYSDNETSRSIRIGISNAMPSATTITNAYRKAKENDPTIQYRMTVSEWRKGYLRSLKKAKKRKEQ